MAEGETHRWARSPEEIQLPEWARNETGGPPRWSGPPGRPPDDPGDVFPPSGIDLVEHQLRIRLDVGRTGRGDEVIPMKGTMMIDRGDPYTNADGLRQIDFVVLSWMASGWSWTLQSVVTYVLSEDEEQPPSSIVSEQPDRDFPATLQFNVVFDARVNNRVVHRRHEGRPEGHGFFAIPPSGNRRTSPRMTVFEKARVAVDHPTLGIVEAIPLDCNDLGSTTVASR